MQVISFNIFHNTKFPLTLVFFFFFEKEKQEEKMHFLVKTTKLNIFLWIPVLRKKPLLFLA